MDLIEPVVHEMAKERKLAEKSAIFSDDRVRPRLCEERIDAAIQSSDRRSGVVHLRSPSARPDDVRFRNDSAGSGPVPKPFRCEPCVTFGAANWVTETASGRSYSMNLLKNPPFFLMTPARDSKGMTGRNPVDPARHPGQATHGPARRHSPA